MAQLSDDCFAFSERLIPLDEAERLIEARVGAVTAAERIAVAGADGRILAADIVAPLALPPFSNSAVDGYAVRFADLAPDRETLLPVGGRVAAGMEAGTTPPGAAVRIFTGAPMPAGADTVFMQEDVRLDETGRAVLPPGLKQGANSRATGEDLDRGATALAAGRRLTPMDLALLGALGIEAVEVRRPLRVALFSTGNEVALPGTPLRPGRLYDANRPMLAALLGRLGCLVSDGGVLPDRREEVDRALRNAAASADLVLTSGGVSAGEEDHVREAAAALGSLTFWRLGIKPGRPVAMAVVGGTPLVGLPGNPVAAFVTFAFVARPLIARLAGESYRRLPPLPARSGFEYRKKGGRREFVRVRLQPGPDGVVAHRHPREGAGIITSLTETDGLAAIGDEVRTVAPGDLLPVHLYATLL